MPPKLRTLLGRSTSAASRMATSRAAETMKQRETRLAQERTTRATSRAVETTDQR